MTLTKSQPAGAYAPISSPAIDAARGLAALAVVTFHAYIWILAPWGPSVFEGGAADWVARLHRLGSDGWSAPLYPVFGLGFLGVNLFFIISGFCIHLPNARRDPPAINLPKFFARRMIRLYPLYAVICVFLFVLYGPILHQYADKGVDAPNIIGHAFFWYYWGPPRAAGMGISLVMWTLALEVVFYVIYAVLYPWIRQVGLGKVAVIWVSVDFAYHLIFPFLPADWALPQVFSPARFAPFRFGEWLLGAWLAERYVKDGLSPAPLRQLALGIGLIAASVIIGGVLGADKYQATDVPGSIGFLLILDGVLAWERRGYVETTRALDWLGARSYSIYLAHATIVLMISKWAAHHTGGPGLSRILLPSGFFLGAIVSALMVASLAYRFIEAPSHQWARRLR